VVVDRVEVDPDGVRVVHVRTRDTPQFETVGATLLKQCALPRPPIRCGTTTASSVLDRLGSQDPMVLCRAGLRRSEAVGLRREDIHFLLDSSGLGCDFPGSHLHVVLRDNVNGAWAKSRHSRTVPVDRLVVQAHDHYVMERADIPAIR
jgi:hypothetical protein